MCRRSVTLPVLIVGLALQLSGCAETAASKPGTGSARFATADGSPASGLLPGVAGNARRLGASHQAVGESAAIVTYGGAPRDFIACAGGSQDASGRKIFLDARTTLTAEGPELRAETDYVATIEGGEGGASSVAFGPSESGRFADGTECRATGQLERSLLGSG